MISASFPLLLSYRPLRTTRFQSIKGPTHLRPLLHYWFFSLDYLPTDISGVLKSPIIIFSLVISFFMVFSICFYIFMYSCIGCMYINKCNVFFLLFIYLALLDLSWHSGSLLRHAGSFVVMHGSVVVLYRLRCPRACGILVPWPGIKPTSSALQGRLLTTGSPRKSFNILFLYWSLYYFIRPFIGCCYKFYFNVYLSFFIRIFVSQFSCFCLYVISLSVSSFTVCVIPQLWCQFFLVGSM